MPRNLSSLLGIAALTIAALVVIWPSQPDDFLPSGIPWPEGRGVNIGGFEREEMRLGLDLQGGTRLLLQASVPEDAGDVDLDDAIEGAISILDRRVNSFGVSEAEITRQGSSSISVQLPGLTPEEARNLLGRTALLRFCEVGQATASASEVCGTATGADGSSTVFVQSRGVIDGESVALTGRFLKPNAFINFDALGTPLIQFEWQGDGPALSEQVTRRLLNAPLGIFLDDELLSAPIVNAVIEDTGVITGVELDRARELVVQLNAGALPVELAVLQEQEVDATLGDDSVRRSVLAGEIGLLIVILFMVLYYRVPGALASLALVIYAVLTLAIFKLIPVTLTLAGIGAFVLSVGMAVDANILIFERMKEEMRAGRAFGSALDAGFTRAWTSIRDSNVTTLITCAILFVLGGGVQVPGLGSFEAPLVRGFAVTLAIGVLVSMFSAVVVTRTLLRTLIGTGLSRQVDLLGPDLRPPEGVIVEAGGDDV